MTLTEKLNSLRTESGLSQSTLAEQMGVARQTVSRWESGEAVPTRENLRRLSELYGVPVGYLLNDGMERPTAVAVAEKPEEQTARSRWRKPALIGVAIGLAIAAVILLFWMTYHAGYDKGVKDATPTYPVHTAILDESDFEEPGDLLGW